MEEEEEDEDEEEEEDPEKCDNVGGGSLSGRNDLNVGDLICCC